MKKLKTLLSLIVTVIILTCTMEVHAAPVKDIGYEKLFNAVYYAERYPDLKAAYGYDTKALYSHFLNYGMYEGRDAHPDFSVKDYKEHYADLKAVYGDNIQKYYEHFLVFGMKEGRYSGVETDYWDNYVDASSITIVMHEGVDPKMADVAREMLNKLPNHYIKQFIDSGWKVEMWGKLVSINSGEQVWGACGFGSNTIKLEGSKAAVQGAILHEFGHYIDHCNGIYSYYTSTDPEFMEIYGSEVGNMTNVFDSYYTEDVIEYFAECFENIYSNKNSLDKKIPNTYNYIKQLESK